MMMSEKADGDVLEMFSFDDVSRCWCRRAQCRYVLQETRKGKGGKDKRDFSNIINAVYDTNVTSYSTVRPFV